MHYTSDKRAKTHHCSELSTFEDVLIVTFERNATKYHSAYVHLARKMKTHVFFVDGFRFESRIFHPERNRKAKHERLQTFWKTYPSDDFFTPTKNSFRVKIQNQVPSSGNMFGFCIGATTSSEYRDFMTGKGCFLGGVGDLGLSWCVTARAASFLHKGEINQSFAFLEPNRLAKNIKTGDVVTVILNYSKSALEFYVNGDKHGSIGDIPVDRNIFPAIGSMEYLQVE